MNENEFDLAARAWLDDGPTQLSDHALRSALGEIHATRQRRVVWPAWRATEERVLGPGWPTLRRLSMAIAVGAAAIVVFAVATVLLSSLPRGIDGPAAASPTSSPSGPTASGGMWPQSTLDEVRAAQELADAGDPAFSWQVGARVEEEDPEAELVERFLREVLGWEAYKFHDGGTFGWNDAENAVEGTVTGQRYLRCALGRANPLYPEESCAPTLDAVRYETVSFDLAQLDRQGRDGIWVVSGWRLMVPFEQADPVAVEAQARERLKAFLAARVAGSDAEWHVRVDNENVPLLYATTAGAPYERYEIERVDEPRWPDGLMTFSVRLFADDDATVVEQLIIVPSGAAFRVDANSTTENGQPIVLSYTSSDGEVGVSAPSAWYGYWPVVDPDLWFGVLWRGGGYPGRESIGFNDPAAYDAWCAANGGRPLLSQPADAAAIAQQLIADPDFEATAPVATRIGGLDAVAMDVVLAPGGQACGVGKILISRWIHELQARPGTRARLYLLDLPEGMSVETMAITVVAPEERFEEVIADTAPIVESIEFHPRASTTSPSDVP